MKKEIMIAGFGGQGVMSIGKSLVEAGLQEGYEVSWVPSYGPEMRGGTANCSVILSSEPIGAPFVYTPSELIAMNGPSLKKFENDVLAGGIIFINSSVVTEGIDREVVSVCKVPCDEIAGELGNPKVANMVMLGAYAAATKALSPATLQGMIRHMFTGPKAKLVDLNLRALERGIACVQ
ncbi:2-oxoacid:acceptor oxidoreductase family protein [Enterocloster clostridioformis]|jgi:2-oxoglutarate ferredoxin oxidoreductase subunit gamma|uniref:2-oxoacid:acceptor oxidoreductase family protein n=1 Tax=Enterocloster clostridioformis TaxID=1531 RepID=UPI0036F250D7